MGLFVIEVAILFIISFVVVRIMGKTALAQLTAYDLLAIFFVVSFAIAPIDFNGFKDAAVGIIVVAVVHTLFSKFSLLDKINEFIVGEPIILIKHGKIVKSNLKGSHFSLIELLSAVRNKGYPDIRDIQYAILEPNGGISVLPKEQVAPVTTSQLNIATEYRGLPIAVVIEGRIQHRNLKLIHRDEEWLTKVLKEKGYNQIKDIFFATVRDNTHEVVVDLGNGTTN